MTLEDVSNNKNSLKCFHCQSQLSHGDQHFVALTSEDGIIQIKNRAGVAAPMVYCSSDCMVYDCKLRYEDRILRGSFRKAFDTQYRDRYPTNWQPEKSELVKD